MAATFTPRFYRLAAVASVASAVTTLGLILLPLAYAPGDGFEARMARVADPAYALRSWVYAVHPVITFAAALAVALRLRRIAPAPALIGALGFHAWAFTELAQQMLTLAAFDRWRVAYAAADASVRAAMPALTLFYDGLWDAAYWVLLCAFTIGNVAFGATMVRRTGLTRIVGACYLGAAMLTLTILSSEWRGPALPAQVSFWAYLLLQPFARTAIGVWLWRNADEQSPSPASW